MKKLECYTKIRNSLIYFTIGCISLLTSSITLASPSSSPIIGIIVPLEVESHYIVQAIKDKKEVTLNGIHYTLGKIDNKNVVFALSGLGKINPAIVATQLLNHFNPELVILSGSSGIIKQQINKGDVIVGKEVENIDLGTLNEKGHVFDYSMHKDLYQPQVKKYLPLAFTLPPDVTNFLTKLNETSKQKFLLGKIASTEVIPNLQQQVRLMKKINVDVVEMEGVSLMQVCWFFQKPCIVVRGASNFTGKPFTPAEVSFAADNAGKVAVEIIKNR